MLWVSVAGCCEVLGSVCVFVFDSVFGVMFGSMFGSVFDVAFGVMFGGCASLVTSSLSLDVVVWSRYVFSTESSVASVSSSLSLDVIV